MTLTCIDLFCGCGGLSKGFQDAGINVICGIDIWDKAIDTYNANFSHEGLCHDITRLDPKDIAKQLNTDHVDIIAGGVPCQAYSMAGKRNPDDPRAYLFRDFVRFVKHFRPKYVVIENVVGILTMKDSNGESVKARIIHELEILHYDVKHATLLAADYGVPQKRRRVFFVGVHKNAQCDMSMFPPVPTHTTLNYVGVGSVLINKADVPASYFHSQRMIDGFTRRKEKNKQNGKGFGAQYLSDDKPSYTISARYWKDGADALVKYSDTEIRKLTEVEVARVQSFPDSFIFRGSSKETYMQIGNAVPAKLAKHVAMSLIDIEKTSKKL